MKKLKPYLPYVPALLAAMAARIVYCKNVWVGLQGDATAYANMAQNLATRGYLGGGSGPDFGRPPLYSITLAGFAKLFDLPFEYWTWISLNLVYDAISVCCLVAIGKRIAPTTAGLGIFLVAISPMWFAHVNSPITEPVSVTLFLLFLERWTREKRTMRDEVLGGLFLGGLTLCRSMFLWFPLGLLIWEFLFFRKSPKGARVMDPGWRRALAFLIAGFVPPLIWGLRNYFVMGQFAVTQASWTAVMMAWYVIHLPLLDWRMNEHVQWISSHPWSNALWGSGAGVDFTEMERLMKAELIDFIKDRPLQYIANLGPKTLRLWVNGWWDPYNYVFSPRYLASNYVWGFVLPILGFGTIGLFQQWGQKAKDLGVQQLARWRAVRTQAFLVIYTTGLTLPFTVDARYSVIAFVCFGLWAGAGMVLVFTPRRSSARD